MIDTTKKSKIIDLYKTHEGDTGSPEDDAFLLTLRKKTKPDMVRSSKSLSFKNL